MSLAAGMTGRFVGRLTWAPTHSNVTILDPACLQNPRLAMGMLDSAYPYLILRLSDLCRPNIIGDYRETRTRDVMCVQSRRAP